MTADEPVEGRECPQCSHGADRHGPEAGCIECLCPRLGVADPPSPSEPVESREQPREAKFEPQPIRGEDVNGETWVRIWDLQKHAPFDEGKVIGYSDLPTVIIQRPDGSHEHWVASLPWERIEPLPLVDREDAP